MSMRFQKIIGARRASREFGQRLIPLLALRAPIELVSVTVFQLSINQHSAASYCDGRARWRGSFATIGLAPDSILVPASLVWAAWGLPPAAEIISRLAKHFES
jgi:hypothetical protein